MSINARLLAVALVFASTYSFSQEEIPDWMGRHASSVTDAEYSCLILFLKKEYSQAIIPCEQSAKSDGRFGLQDLGLMYLLGLGTTADKVRGIELLKRAAALPEGPGVAEHNLGVAYSQGVGVAQDAGTAASWFKKGAFKGHQDAQYNLSFSYLYGDGVDQNMVEGLAWLKVSSRYGSTDATGILSEIGQYFSIPQPQRAKSEARANQLIELLPPPETEQMKQISDLMRRALDL